MVTGTSASLATIILNVGASSEKPFLWLSIQRSYGHGRNPGSTRGPQGKTALSINLWQMCSLVAQPPEETEMQEETEERAKRAMTGQQVKTETREKKE